MEPDLPRPPMISSRFGTQLTENRSSHYPPAQTRGDSNLGPIANRSSWPPTMMQPYGMLKRVSQFAHSMTTAAACSTQALVQMGLVSLLHLLIRLRSSGIQRAVAR